MLVLNLGISRVEDPEFRHGRAEQTLRGVGHPVRVSRVEPPGVVLRDHRHRRQSAAEPGLQILVADLRLD